MTIQIISGSAHPALSKKVAKYLGITLSPTENKRFADGETYVRIKRKVRGDDVFLIQPVCPPVNDNLIELLVTIDALKRANVGKINVVAPYLGYTRQDRKVVSREPISAKLVANLISTAGADRIFCVDLHKDQIQGFFDIPVDHFVGYPFFADYFKRQKIKDLVIIAPDVGAVDKARKMATLLSAPIAFIDKRRSAHNKSEVLKVVGEVKGKMAVILDDIIDTGGTITAAAKAVIEGGAREVKICATHAILSGDAADKLQNSAATEVLFLDTIPIAKDKMRKKMKQLSMAKLLAKAIKRIHQGKSLGKLFTWEDKLTQL